MMHRFALFLAVPLSFALGLAVTAQADAYERAAHYIEEGKNDTAVRHLERGARKGDPRCQFMLGMVSLSGTGGEQDLEKGAQLVGEAAAQDLPIAQSYLGVLYSSGLGVAADPRNAAEWFEKAALYGEPIGQAGLGIASFLGDGVPEDRVDSYKWISLAAAQGNERAATHLPILEQALTTEEIDEGKKRASAFRPKVIPAEMNFKPDFKLFDGNRNLRRSTSGAGGRGQ